jgi:hypothetical protein
MAGQQVCAIPDAALALLAESDPSPTPFVSAAIKQTVTTACYRPEPDLRERPLALAIARLALRAWFKLDKAIEDPALDLDLGCRHPMTTFLSAQHHLLDRACAAQRRRPLWCP